ncbi:hypothetical protein [Phenylobacterium sp.]|uniref:hypothetical protein n=1 Tax=Phenylobacterium sp. TaxID=1871053 RepID=UPI0025F5EBCA|nr:hypothetical protein [Phenylobacterium sp.]
MILLPAVGVDWRWYPADAPNPWYPSATLVRQAIGGDWAKALAVAEARAAI